VSFSYTAKGRRLNERDNNAVVPMINNATGQIDFDVILYGISPIEAMVIPCQAIQELAQQYPSYTASLFLIKGTHS